MASKFQAGPIDSWRADWVDGAPARSKSDETWLSGADATSTADALVGLVGLCTGFAQRDLGVPRGPGHRR